MWSDDIPETPLELPYVFELLGVFVICRERSYDGPTSLATVYSEILVCQAELTMRQNFENQVSYERVMNLYDASSTQSRP